jgi:hypothetical protein
MKENAPLSTAWLNDFYASNQDGVGVMYAERNELIIKKILPVSAADFVDFYRSEIQGKRCAFHLRMRTHGNTDLTNCHPYKLLDHATHGVDMALMHNGILSTGNARDTTKSDTWHYIRDILRPLLKNNPDYAFTKGFADLVGAHIGYSNKFVIMDSRGRMATVNKGAGVFFAGLWLSNTYAWSAPTEASKKFDSNRELQIAQANGTPVVKGYTWTGKGSKWSRGYNGYANAWMDEDETSYYSDTFATATVKTPVYNAPKKFTPSSYVKPVDVAPVSANVVKPYDLIAYEVDALMDDLDVEQIDYMFTENQAYNFARAYGLDTFKDLALMVLDDIQSVGLFNRAVLSPDSVASELGLVKLKP